MRLVPLEVFVFVGTFLEELISPIPSFIVMVPAGSAVQASGGSLLYLLWLATIASAGRMIAGTILYFAADKLEDVIFANGRSFWGMNHKNIEGFGKKLSKKTKHTWLILFAVSAVPFLPTATLSLTCGFIKVRYRTFITSNFLGSIVNGFCYLYMGYVGLQAARLLGRLDFWSQIITGIAAVIAIIWWIIWRRGKSRSRKK